MSILAEIESIAVALASVQGIPINHAKALGTMVGKVWQAWVQGHTALPVETLTGEDKALLESAQVRALMQPLSNARLKNRPTVSFPVWLEYDHLFLVRNAVAEAELAEKLKERVNAPSASDGVRAELIGNLRHTGLSDEQQAIVRAILSSPLVLVSGGPGTGKTRTLAAAIEALHTVTPNAVIYGLAPTGKAAARLAESLHSLAVDKTGLKTQTIQLALSRDRAGLATADLVIVDEASMLDLELAMQLVNALSVAKPKMSRLVLAGDVDQLASVQPGAVFAQLAQSLPTFRLNQNFRAQAQTELVGLCDSLRAGNFETFMTGLGKPISSQDVDLSKNGVFWLDMSQGEGLALSALSLAAIDWHRANREDVQKRLDGLKILAGPNQGSLGVDTLNAAIAYGLHPGAIKHDQIFDGALVMNRRNDWVTGLSNGDIGVCQINSQSGKLEVQFKERTVRPSQVHDAELALAISVHKSQGSEYERVVFFCPQAQSPLATRELLYTAISRAKKQLIIAASLQALEACFANRTQRFSALAQRLRSGSNTTLSPSDHLLPR